MTGAPPLRLELRGSPVLALLTLAVHAAAAAVLLAVLPIVPAVCAAGAIAILAMVAIRERALLIAPRAPRALLLGYDGSLAVGLGGGPEEGASPDSRRYVSRWLVILGLARAVGGHRTILVARDMLSSEEFRKLRLWALWGKLPHRAAHRPAERTISTDTCL